LSSPKSDFSSSAGVGRQSASFVSNTSIADAHIRALPKPVDLCAAFAKS
jgi:hypothetical protein